MTIQSRTYNNGQYLEYIYTIVPLIGATYKQNVFIRISDGVIVNPSELSLTLDKNSENIFQGICCPSTDICDGWQTQSNECWVTSNDLSWAFD